MGAWSAKIFDDDGAQDITEEYKILLGYKIPPQEAYQKIEEYFYPDYRGQHDEDVYWLSIALFQWKNGILSEKVKQRALECIADESYLERWKDSGEKIYQERKKVLEDLQYKLVNVVNEERKKFPKCPRYYRYKTEWEEGDLLAYKMTAPIVKWGELVSPGDKEKFYHVQKQIKSGYLLLRVVEIVKEPVSVICPELDYCSSAIVMLYDWMGDVLPTDQEVGRLSFRPMVDDYWEKKKTIASSISLDLEGTKGEKEWGEITLVKREKDFLRPEMYVQHRDGVINCIRQFVTTLIFTFAIDKTDETEWQSDKRKRFFDSRE